MTYVMILIVAMNFRGTAAVVQEFSDADACKAAVAEIMKYRYDGIVAFCVPKGSR